MAVSFTFGGSSGLGTLLARAHQNKDALEGEKGQEVEKKPTGSKRRKIDWSKNLLSDSYSTSLACQEPDALEEEPSERLKRRQRQSGLAGIGAIRKRNLAASVLKKRYIGSQVGFIADPGCNSAGFYLTALFLSSEVLVKSLGKVDSLPQSILAKEINKHVSTIRLIGSVPSSEVYKFSSKFFDRVPYDSSKLSKLHFASEVVRNILEKVGLDSSPTRVCTISGNRPRALLEGKAVIRQASCPEVILCLRDKTIQPFKQWALDKLPPNEFKVAHPEEERAEPTLFKLKAVTWIDEKKKTKDPESEVGRVCAIRAGKEVYMFGLDMKLSARRLSSYEGLGREPGYLRFVHPDEQERIRTNFDMAVYVRA